MSKLLEQILSRENMNLAYKKVKANKGAGGIDDVSVDEVYDYIKQNWKSIREKIKKRKYRPQPVLRVEIPKPDGGVRKLGIPTVMDRIIEQAVVQVITPIAEPHFSEYSYGFRPGRRAQQAVIKMLEYLNDGYTYIVDIDLEKFFDNVNQDKLMTLVHKIINDPDTESLIAKYLKAGVMVEGKYEDTVLGTPQGGNLSPILSNIMLNELDKELESRGLHFVRYADDCVIAVGSSAAANRVMHTVTKWIERKLGLKVNMQLEIERQALSKEEDGVSQKRLDAIEKELSELNNKNDTMRTQWESEKRAITEVKDTKKEIENTKLMIEEAERKYDLEKLAELKYGTLPALEKKLEEEKEETGDPKENKLLKEEVTEEEIAEVVSQWTGIPVSRLQETERQKLLRLPEILHERVIGQEEAVEAVSEAILRARAGLKDESRPIGSFIFMGPTGVGKTELAKALSEALFDSEKNLIRIDMSEYMEKHSVSRLVGAPPGYVGYDQGGQLTEAVRRHPYSVILFDEIEKAHPDVFNILLQLLDDGRLTDNQGRTVDFKNTIVILTSNIGSAYLTEHINDDGTVDPGVKEEVTEELKRNFRPEFINRIDDIVVFSPLTEAQIMKIIDLSVAEIQSRLAERDITIKLTDESKKLIAKEAYTPQYGARPVKRYLQKYIETGIAERIIKGEITDGQEIIIDASQGQQQFTAN